jgi:hypothetical protein
MVKMGIIELLESWSLRLHVARLNTKMHYISLFSMDTSSRARRLVLPALPSIKTM